MKPKVTKKEEKKEAPKDNIKKIAGVSINLDHPDIKKIKNYDDVKKWAGFNHLTDDNLRNASDELLSSLGGGSKQIPKDAPDKKLSEFS